MEKQGMNQQPLHAKRRGAAEIRSMPGRELTDKRTETAKLYSLGENLYQMVMSEEPMHYRDKATGAWVDIDNTLVTERGADGRAQLVNRHNGCLKARMADADAAWTVQLEDERGHTLRWRMSDTASTKGMRRKGGSCPTALACGGASCKTQCERQALQKAESAAAYADILPDTDMRCHLQGSTFKEEIIFKTLGSGRSISFDMEADGLRLTLMPDQSIQAVDADGSVAFELPPPFMLDAEGNMGRVFVGLTQQGLSAWSLVYAPDMQFLADAAYPVVLDPTVRATDQSAAALCKNAAKKAAPDTVFKNTATIAVEDAPSAGRKTLGFYRFESEKLPVIDASYYITNADLTLTSSNRNVQLFAHEVLEAWDADTLTYDNMPAIHDMATDVLKSGSGTLSVTNMVRRWYEGENNGFAVQVHVETETQSVSTNVSSPTLSITFVSLAGLEDYLAYESHGLGRAGTAHVGLFNGNLVVSHTDTQTSGSRMPLSISHHFNACYRNMDLYNTGLGWRHSLQVTLHKQQITGDSTQYYVLTDGNGTRHFFKSTSGGKYEDMSGLYLTLTISGGKATIEDKGNNQMEFDTPTINSDGTDDKFKLVKLLRNAQGDTIQVTADADNRITEAKDGAGRLTRFAYTEEKRLSTIIAPGETEGVRFFYDEAGHLVRIVDEDDTEAIYRYDEDGQLVGMDNYGRKLDITYQAGGARRVTSVREYHNTMEGNKRLYAYGDCATTVTDGTVADGKKLIYHFNDYGNVISTNDMLGQASFVKFTGTVPLHRPETISKTQRSVTNLLHNHDFEGTDGWKLYCSASYAQSKQRTGMQCLRLTSPEEGGGLQYASQDVMLERGKTYTLSCYAMRSGDISFWAAVQYEAAPGTMKTIKSEPLEAGLSPDDYFRRRFTFTIPADAHTGRATVFFCTNGDIRKRASIWIDSAQLEAGEVPNQYNMLTNGNFARMNGDSKPDGWQENEANKPEDCVLSLSPDAERPDNIADQAMRFVGKNAKAAGIYQEMKLLGKKDDVFVAGGWSNGFSAPRKGEKKKYNIRIAFQVNGAFVDYKDEVQWADEWSGWQFASGPVIAPDDYTAIRFHIDYASNINHADFAAMFLYKEEFGWSYTYDAFGNVTSVRDLSGKYKHARYDAYNNLIEYIPIGQTDRAKVEMNYGTTAADQKKHLLRKSTSPLGIVQTYEYDSAGNNTLRKMVGADNDLFVQTETQYSADKNHVLSSFDAKGKMTIQQTDPQTDLVQYAGGEGGASAIYSYDDKKRLTGSHIATADQTIRNRYEYDDNYHQLTAVSHNTTSENGDDVTVHLKYDALGNRTDVSVGDRLIARTIYTDTGDKLPIAQEFGNGGSVRMERDAFKRVTGVLHDADTAPRYRYAYDASGDIAKMTDESLSRTYTTEHDLGYRPVSYREMEGTENVYTQEIRYDECNRVARKIELVGEDYRAYESKYMYDLENKPTEIQLGDERTRAQYGYDKLGRLERRTIRCRNGIYDTKYTYQTGGYGAKSTTGTVEKIEQPGHNFDYTIRGGIAAERHNGVRTGYQYDDIGQLKRVNDEAQQKTFTYKYDQGGNILRKSEHAYTTKQKAGPALSTVEYGYGDAGWKDMLTSYDGVPIQSDAIGNVLDDGAWQYSWEAGRRLAQMEAKDGSDALAFAYNASGLRVRKESQTRGVTEYTLSGAQIVHQRRGNVEMHFFYADGNSPAMVTYRGITYGYVYNLQGDVVALVELNGHCPEAVAYTYDAWGKQIGCTGPMAETLGRENPFRYRGYVFDEETGLYYLRTRYYNPEWGRFVSADSLLGRIGELGAHNLFAYCMNNPIMFSDSNGTYPVEGDRPTNKDISDYLAWVNNYVKENGRHPNDLPKNTSTNSGNSPKKQDGPVDTGKVSTSYTGEHTFGTKENDAYVKSLLGRSGYVNQFSKDEKDALKDILDQKYIHDGKEKRLYNILVNDSDNDPMITNPQDYDMDRFYDIFWNLYYGNREYSKDKINYFSTEEIARMSRVVGKPEEFGYAYEGSGKSQVYVTQTDKGADEHTEWKMFFCCAYLTQEILGGKLSANDRLGGKSGFVYERDYNTLLGKIHPRYEIGYEEEYGKFSHVSTAINYDFGSGYQIGVIQSASKPAPGSINGPTDVGPTISYVSDKAVGYLAATHSVEGNPPKGIYRNRYIDEKRKNGITDNCWTVQTP